RRATSSSRLLLGSEFRDQPFVFGLAFRQPLSELRGILINEDTSATPSEYELSAKTSEEDATRRPPSRRIVVEVENGGDDGKHGARADDEGTPARRVEGFR